MSVPAVEMRTMTSLVDTAESIRVETTATLDSMDQARLGQFFTPAKAAALIASLPTLPTKGTLRVLDPGAGSGMLTAALVERVAAEAPSVRIEVTAVELDETLLPALERTARRCEVWARERGVSCTVQVLHHDLIEATTGLGGLPFEGYDLVIMNPPYAKLASNSFQRTAVATRGWDAPNLYAAFIAIGLDVLRDGGQIVAITPRSFANGPYFARFRKRLLREASMDRLHTFESRSTVFADTGVLQENIIFSATKASWRDTCRISVSHGHTDEATEHTVAYTDLVRPGDPESFIRIPTGSDDTDAAEYMAALPSTLGTLGIKVSTGRIVDFRSRENLVENAGPGDAPLVYPGNLREGIVIWPRSIRKPQGFKVASDADRRMLMPAGHYVVVKRFSSKEERRRIVASLWNPTQNGNDDVAFENHLNVFHQDGKGLDPHLAWGLCLWLNGTVVDRFFRTFSGHTQVNATDLRALRYPSDEALRHLARAVPAFPDQDALDALIDQTIQRQEAA